MNPAIHRNVRTSPGRLTAVFDAPGLDGVAVDSEVDMRL
jgi:hypothetical protein